MDTFDVEICAEDEVSINILVDTVLKYETVIQNVIINQGGGSQNMSGQIRKDENVAVTSPQVITFNIGGTPAPFSDSNWAIAITCYDSMGAVIFGRITNRTAAGFTVDFGDTGIIEYLAIHD